MTRIVTAAILALLFLPVHAQSAITARWEGATLIIDAADGSLYLAGGDRIETYIGWLHVELPIDPTRPDYTPTGRERINLRGHSTVLLASIPIPPLPAPTLIASWGPAQKTLTIAASPGSLYIVGGGRPDTYIGEESVVLKAEGADQNYTPVGRERIELRDSSGLVLLWLPVPRREWVQILPIIVHQNTPP